MSKRMYRTVQALILVLLALFLLNRIWSGTLYWYINTRFLPLMLVGAFGMLLLAQATLANRDTRLEDVGPDPELPSSTTNPGTWLQLIMLALPVILGTFMPAQPLGSSALINKGLATTAPLRTNAEGSPLWIDVASEDRNVLDWIRAFNTAADPQTLSGQPAEVIGFVYNDPRLEQGQFLLGRFTLTCCVADAVAIGLIVEFPGTEFIPDNTWVRVRGPIRVGQLAGELLPRIEAETIEEIPLPEQPYLYN